MTLLRSGFCLLALSLTGAAHAAESPKGEACDVICELQAYLNRDHMVTYVPAPPPLALKTTKPLRPRLRMATRPLHRHVARRTLPPGIAEVTPAPAPLSQSAPRQTAQWSPPPSTLKPLPEPASQPAPPALIPGSAPLVTPQFAPLGSL